jgi:hypothetical protein
VRQAVGASGCAAVEQLDGLRKLESPATKLCDDASENRELVELRINDREPRSSNGLPLADGIAAAARILCEQEPERIPVGGMRLLKTDEQ